MRNFIGNFYKDVDSFLHNLQISQADSITIREAVAEIKAALQKGISQEYGISPRFMTQGSARYKTLNTPCIIPPQQMDHDVGCYLPLSYHMDEKKPKQASGLFFKTADTILLNLVKAKKWKSFSDSKDTCCRVEVTDTIHIDIPLYSVPDKEFETIREARKSLNSFTFADSRDSIYNTENEETWDDFKFENVMLAHRKKGWRVSDPRKLNEYFENIVSVKGEQIRRLFRYMKAFRDKQWIVKGHSSIFLMCVVDSIIQSKDDTGDDLVLLGVLGKFSELASCDIVNPTDSEEKISISTEDYRLLKQKSGEFHDDLKKALEDISISGESACRLIQKHLGNRFPIKNNPFDKERLRDEVLGVNAKKQDIQAIPARTYAG